MPSPAAVMPSPPPIRPTMLPMPTCPPPLSAALTTRSADLLPWLDSAPQTNEVARSAVLIAVGHWLSARFGLPLVLSELGASAGLNLLWDHYALALPDAHRGPPDPVLTLTPEWTGPLPPATPAVIAARAGVDLSPLDPVRDRERMLAYVWADQTARHDRASAALTLAARLNPSVTQGDAADWTEHRLRQSFPGQLHLLYHTVAAQYFPAPTKARIAAALTSAGARATEDAPLAHFAMETDGNTPGAALTLTLWPGGQTHTLWPRRLSWPLGHLDRAAITCLARQPPPCRLGQSGERHENPAETRRPRSAGSGPAFAGAAGVETG